MCLKHAAYLLEKLSIQSQSGEDTYHFAIPFAHIKPTQLDFFQVSDAQLIGYLFDPLFGDLF